ncbi:MAG: M48 family metallopeptidase [Hyphomicrobiaceae bacterium]
MARSMTLKENKKRKTTPLTDPRLKGLGAPVEVRRHPKARRLTLRVSRTRRAVIVTLPPRCDIGEAGTFVHSNIDWVRKCLGDIPEPVPFNDKAIIPLRGIPHLVSFIGQRLANGTVCTVDRGPDLYPEIRVGGQLEHAPRRLHDWLFSEVRRDLDRCIQQHARFLNLTPKRFTVRDQTSRWGSCSSTGSLSFSWRLILAPPFVLDYVAAHEVAHLSEMNHGQKFWALVHKTMPRTPEAKQWLQIYGMDLHRYGLNND